MVVRMRSTKSHRNNRRSHFALVAPRLSVCKDCGSRHVSHRVCAVCGKYNGRQVLDFSKKLARKEKKVKAKENAQG